jgi:hypothetical protein
VEKGGLALQRMFAAPHESGPGTLRPMLCLLNVCGQKQTNNAKILSRGLDRCDVRAVCACLFIGSKLTQCGGARDSCC